LGIDVLAMAFLDHAGGSACRRRYPEAGDTVTKTPVIGAPYLSAI